jgi:hypothetical protein
LRSRPADLSPGESGAVEPWRPAPLLVYAADRKQVCPAHGPILRGVEGAAMREIGEYEVSAVAAVGDLLCRFHVCPSPSGKPQATARGLRGTAGSFRCDPQCCAISADDCLLIAGKQTWSAGLRIVALAIVRARGLNL